MTPEQQALFDNYRHMPRVVVYRYYREAAEWVRDEALSAGLLGLWQAALTYPPGAKFAFGVHAFLQVRRAIGNWMDTLGVFQRYRRVHERVAVGCLDSLPWPNRDDEDCYGDINAAVNDLTPKLLDVVRLSYYDGWSQHDIAGILGIPEGTVASRLGRARVLLREALANYSAKDNNHAEPIAAGA